MCYKNARVGEEGDVSFSTASAAPRTARATVASQMRRWSCAQDSIETARVLVAELVVQIVNELPDVDVGAALKVDVERFASGAVRVTVSYPSSSSAVLLAPSCAPAQVQSQRWLMLLMARLAGRWSWHSADGHSVIWFEVPGDGYPNGSDHEDGWSRQYTQR